MGGALGWMAFGALVLVASWRMDRLESLHINPWSAPGLVPGLLGALMMLFGLALGLRSLYAAGAPVARRSATLPRTALALVLCVGYAAGLLGHGLPFWLSSAVFLFAAIFAFRFLDRAPDAPPARLALTSAVIALVAAAVISLVFQEIFLVRLP